VMPYAVTSVLRIAGRRILPTPNGFFARWQTLEAQRGLRLRNVVLVFLSSGEVQRDCAPAGAEALRYTTFLHNFSLLKTGCDHRFLVASHPVRDLLLCAFAATSRRRDVAL